MTTKSWHGQIPPVRAWNPIYLTWQPRRGLADNLRNCISNVRPEGLPYDEAVLKLRYLVRQSLKLQLTGVALKDDSDQLTLDD